VRVETRTDLSDEFKIVSEKGSI